MRASPELWALRGLAILDVAWLLIVHGRSLRAHRAAQFKVRPSTAQGLAGRYAPAVTLVVPSPDGRAGPWLSRISYPSGRLEVVVAVPPRVRVQGAPKGSRIAVGSGGGRGALVQAALRVATGEVLVVLPPELGVGRGFVKRLVAPLIDPFVGAAVARVVAARPSGGVASLVDDIDRLARSSLQVGRHVVGAPVTSEDEPFAVSLRLLGDLGWDPAHPAPDTDLVMRVYARGFAVAYVEEAVALAPALDWAGLSERIARRLVGLRTLWRPMRRAVWRRRVLEGPEKTDVRWITRGANAPLWLLAGWVLDGALRVADTSWAPEAIAVPLLLATFSTAVGLVPFVTLSTAAVQNRRLGALALEPWLAPMGLAALWTGTGAALSAPVRTRLRRGPVRRVGERPRAGPPERRTPEPAPPETVTTPRAQKPPGPPPRRRPPAKRRGTGAWEG